MSSELDRCFSDPGYTPPAAALPELLGQLHALSDERALLLERVVARAGVAAGRAALDLLPGASAEQRRRLLSVVKRLCDETCAALFLEALLRAVDDPDPKCRRIVFRALGNLADARAETPLLAQLAREQAPEQRAIVEALGKLGTELSEGVLAALDTPDAELVRIGARARVLIARRRERVAPSALAFEHPLEREAPVALLCRSGLSHLLADELRALSPHVVSPSRVDVRARSSLGDLLAARIALEFAVVIPLDGRIADPAARVIQALLSEDARRVLRAWTLGKPRFRLEFPGGHRRALTWKIAERVGAEGLVNDSREWTWTARVSPECDEIQLLPRLTPDPRFAYRVAEVPGASHPTIAAALSRHAGVRADDVVWDPFVGSGLELVERARLGPYERLLGSDVEPRALDAAAKNLGSARVTRAQLSRGDARTFAPSGIRLIITNPPMGRRVTRDGSLGALLDGFVPHVARVLEPGGRMVWLSPDERRTDELARAAGLRVHSGPEVDLGGFGARLQTYERPAR